eukprot:6211981-Pleurochrysis_carterae.AAC.3
MLAMNCSEHGDEIMHAATNSGQTTPETALVLARQGYGWLVPRCVDQMKPAGNSYKVCKANGVSHSLDFDYSSKAESRLCHQ